MGILNWFRGRKMYEEEYHRTAAHFPMPSVAYTTALLQFQEYPRNMVEGFGGVLVKAFPKPYAPQYANALLTPVNAGTSGTIAAQFFNAPLIDTTNRNQAG